MKAQTETDRLVHTGWKEKLKNICQSENSDYGIFGENGGLKRQTAKVLKGREKSVECPEKIIGMGTGRGRSGRVRLGK